MSGGIFRRARDFDAGQNLLKRDWETTKEEFERNLEQVKKARVSPSGAYDGPTIFLYTEHATGIRHRGQLERLLEESEDLWIVPADVHF